jgi:hypothetical protein
MRCGGIGIMVGLYLSGILHRHMKSGFILPISHGDLVYTFTRPWSDGTTGITLSPLDLLEKLAALVPLPRVMWYGMGAVWRRTVACLASRCLAPNVEASQRGGPRAAADHPTLTHG